MILAEIVVRDMTFPRFRTLLIPPRINSDGSLLCFIAADISGFRFCDINIVVNHIAVRQEIARLDLLTLVFITTGVGQFARTDDFFRLLCQRNRNAVFRYRRVRDFDATFRQIDVVSNQRCRRQSVKVRLPVFDDRLMSVSRRRYRALRDEVLLIILVDVIITAPPLAEPAFKIVRMERFTAVNRFDDVRLTDRLTIGDIDNAFDRVQLLPFVAQHLL